ncbi:MAG: TetR family transcriptional regulator [Candidatus Nephthysia bennettiae]|nr:MAG: TetR family transcriptional regulator [Candidatus Dormibacteraeota bacterium]
MNPLLEPGRPRPGLRERKKAKTRAAIQEHALRLFRQRGYEGTTVDEIADAAEVSPSTFFRYFPTKEDVVLYDALDPVLLEAFEAQPAGLSPVAALRATIREVIGGGPAGVFAPQDERAALILSVPELRMRMLDEFARSMFLFAGVVAKRVGREPDDLAVRALVGAAVGVGIAVWVNARGVPASDYLRQMDEGLAQLEAGFPALSRK